MNCNECKFYTESEWSEKPCFACNDENNFFEKKIKEVSEVHDKNTN